MERISEKKTKSDVVFVYFFGTDGPTLRAADAAGAAPEMGVIVGRRGTPPLVPVGGCRQRRR